MQLFNESVSSSMQNSKFVTVTSYPKWFRLVLEHAQEAQELYTGIPGVNSKKVNEHLKKNQNPQKVETLLLSTT